MNPHTDIIFKGQFIRVTWEWEDIDTCPRVKAIDRLGPTYLAGPVYPSMRAHQIINYRLYQQWLPVIREARRQYDLENYPEDTDD